MTGNAIAMQIWAEGPLGLQALQLACLAQTMPPTRCFKNVLHAPPETVKADAENSKGFGPATSNDRKDKSSPAHFRHQSQGRKNTCSPVPSRTDP
jgi:hypothetical protein